MIANQNTACRVRAACSFVFGRQRAGHPSVVMQSRRASHTARASCSALLLPLFQVAGARRRDIEAGRAHFSWATCSTAVEEPRHADLVGAGCESPAVHQCRVGPGNVSRTELRTTVQSGRGSRERPASLCEVARG